MNLKSLSAAPSIRPAHLFEVIDAQRSARDLDTVVVQVEDALRQARLELLVALGLFPR